MNEMEYFGTSEGLKWWIMNNTWSNMEAYTLRVFFSKFLMGELIIFGPRQSPTGTKSDGGGGTCEKNPTEAKTAHPMQN